MKRAALGAVLISLVAGPTAFAGSALPPALHNYARDDRGHEQHRPDNRNEGRHDNDRRFDGNHRDDRRGDDRRDDRRWEGRRDDHRWNEGPRHDGDWNNHRGVSPPRYADPPRYTNPPRHDYRRENGRWNWGTYNRPYGYAPHYWRRGERLPGAYYGSRYVVSNYYDCGLRAPPYGYHWVRIDHDVVLAAIATGLVLDVIYNQFW